MSVTQSAIPQSELIANMLSMVPPSYRVLLNRLMAELHPEGVYLFIRFFIHAFNSLPSTLLPELTILFSYNSVLHSLFLTKLGDFTEAINTVHSYLLTIIYCNLPSPDLRSLCSHILADLHFNLFTNINMNIPTWLSLQEPFLRPGPPMQPSSELDILLMVLVDGMVTGLFIKHCSLIDEFDSLPDPPYSDQIWNLLDFLKKFKIYVCIQRLQDYSDDNSTAGNSDDDNHYDLEELSVKYVHLARINAKTDPEKCMVCLKKMKHGDDARRICCMHSFHVGCIDRWLEMSATCPICRTHINATYESEYTLNGA